MSPEERELLEKALKLSEENNTLLKKMRRSVILGRVVRVIYWLFIIAIAMGAYYFIQPYVEVLKESYNDIMSSFESIKSVGDSINSVPLDIGSIIELINLGN